MSQATLSPIEVPAAQAPAKAAARGTLRLPLDPLLTLAALGLGACSIFTLRGATRNLVPGQPSYYVDRQIVYLVAGLLAMLVLSRIDYAKLRHLRHGLYGALMLSIFAVLALGHSANGAQRAINFPFFSFQASELGKVLLILVLAAYVAERRQSRGAGTAARVVGLALLPAVFVILQPDLGSGLVYMAIAFVVLLIAGAPWRHLAGLAGLAAVGVLVVLVAAPAVGVHVLKPYQVDRLTAFLHPSSNPQKQGYQQQESKIAIGSGQKTGRGVNATQTRLKFVPEDHTDFIFAAVGEQYGFVGAALVLSLYALLIWRALRVLATARDPYGSLVAAGVVAMLMFQVFVNVGMSVGIMPITGVTLPLMSYGGSSVMTTLLAVGLLQSIYSQARATDSLKGPTFRY
jgi:rod shape determining protein RodA